MNKWLFTGLGLLLVAGIFLNTRISRQRHFDRSVTYTPATFRPYDTRFFYQALKHRFTVQRSARAPGGTAFTGTGKTYVVCSPYFHPNQRERHQILGFVSAGNTLLLSSFEIDPRFLRTLRLNASSFTKPKEATADSLQITWKTGETWTYPGSAAAPRILLSSSHPGEILAVDGNGFPALIRMSFGEGTILLQAHPMALSNYFLLHKQNASYLDRLLQETAGQESKVIWDDYYPALKKASDRSGRRDPPPPEGKSFFLDMVKKHPPLQWAVFTALAGAILFVLNYSRRLRQPVEPLPDTPNNTLEFSKTIAGLYLRQNDHGPIVQKIRLQLLEHLFQAYRIHAADLVPENAAIIHKKTGKPLADVLLLTETLPLLHEKISDQALTRFYKLVYKFIYQ